MKRSKEEVLAEIDQDLLRKLFAYDAESGVFKRIGRLKRGGQVVACDFVTNSKSTHGYYQYTIKDHTFDVHRLIWMWVHGKWPDGDIDHINGNRQDNRWENLRVVSRTENLRNTGRKTEPKYGHVGVYAHGKTWRVSIGAEGKAGFVSYEEAVAYRQKRERELGYSENHYKREVWREEKETR
jgi:hypothetical protein